MPAARDLLSILLLLCVFPALAGQSAHALEVRGELGMEAWGFAQQGAQGQSQSDVAASAKIELWQHFNGEQDQLGFTPFFRIDHQDGERSHIDVREAAWLHVGDGYELRSGIRQVFWGVTEATHLVDIINQTDLVERIDGEQRLGQGMINLSLEREAQTLDLFLLTGSRKRTVHGEDGRLRLPVVIDNDLSAYESSRKSRRIDLAARWQLKMPALHVGFSGFSGTAREPEYQAVVDPARLVFTGPVPSGFQSGYAPTLAPYYPLINQAGLELQWTQGDLLWKLEAIQRNGGERDYHALDAGWEYTQVGAFGSAIDIGWLAEYLHDSRDEFAITPFEHDVLVGWRIAFNNAASSDLLASLIIDTETQEQLFSVEAHHRLSDAFRVGMELRVFNHTPAPQSAFDFLFRQDPEHKLRSFADDDYLRLELSWFF